MPAGRRPAPRARLVRAAKRAVSGTWCVAVGAEARALLPVLAARGVARARVVLAGAGRAHALGAMRLCRCRWGTRLGGVVARPRDRLVPHTPAHARSAWRRSAARLIAHRVRSLDAGLLLELPARRTRSRPVHHSTNSSSVRTSPNTLKARLQKQICMMPMGILNMVSFCTY